MTLGVEYPASTEELLSLLAEVAAEQAKMHADTGRMLQALWWQRVCFNARLKAKLAKEGTP